MPLHHFESSRVSRLREIDHRWLVLTSANQDFGTQFAFWELGEDLGMIRKQSLSRSQTPEATDAVQLAHIDSELCWCDPIVDFDEKGQQSMIHNEVTWN